MSTPGLLYFVVDAFTSQPFAGNPAAVVPLAQWREDRWLQNVAMEMNLAETAFLVPREGGFDLRWFTPKVEVDLCGHATIAAAAALDRLGQLPAGAAVAFSTRSGVLTATRQGSRIELDFPALPQQPCEPHPALLPSLGVAVLYVGRSTFDYLVEVESESAVRGIAPDFRRLASAGGRGVVVTARSDDPRFDFVSRFFAPAEGIDEDPVTGSAHCLLAPFWGRQLGKSSLLGYQASARGGEVHAEVRGERILLGGETVIVASGELTVD